MSVGAGGRVWGQQYSLWARALVDAFQRGLQQGLGKEGGMGSCLAEGPALLSAHGKEQGHGW